MNAKRNRDCWSRKVQLSSVGPLVGFGTSLDSLVLARDDQLAGLRRRVPVMERAKVTAREEQVTVGQVQFGYRFSPKKLKNS
jgi:hypothetical protein